MIVKTGCHVASIAILDNEGWRIRTGGNSKLSNYSVDSLGGTNISTQTHSKPLIENTLNENITVQVRISWGLFAFYSRSY